ncbi:tyrosine-type recombinase/integrase [Cupriavidus sp. UYPR2.512]|uniref:tyrosine-type recombinase/integrase n=1 Tax=Cupriavidus sp. UYPR2.512 TaxID=1080187 RepID=UPI00350FCC17
MAAVFDAIEARPAPTLWAQLHKARDRVLLALLFQTGLRASEVAALTWPDFARQRGKAGGFWTVRIRHAKGGDDQLVPCDNVMGELARFRLLVGLSPEPKPTDTMAVIPAIAGGRQRAAPLTDPLALQRKLARDLHDRARRVWRGRGEAGSGRLRRRCGQPARGVDTLATPCPCDTPAALGGFGYGRATLATSSRHQYDTALHP